MRYTEEQYVESASIQARIIDELNTELKALKKVNETQAEQLILHGVSKRYFLFECINADRQKLKKLIIAPDRETAIADIETNYPYIEKWYSSEELNVC